MSRPIVRDGIALVGAAAILFLAGWLDGQVFRDIQRGVSRFFDYGLVSWTLPLGYLMVAASVIAVVGLAVWSKSLLVGVVYAAVGAFFAFLFTLTWLFATEINGVPPVLPQPLVVVISRIWLWGAEGPLNAVSIIGAAMLLAGLASIALVVWRRVTTPREPQGT